MTTNEASKQVARYYHVWRETNRIYSDWAKKHDISYNALLILYSLWNAKHYCTQKMICDQWMLPKQTVNTILKEFEKKELVFFGSTPYDHRKRGIRRTDAGIAYAQDVIPKLMELETQAMEKMGKDRADALIENTALFIDYFKEGMNHE